MNKNIFTIAVAILSVFITSQVHAIVNIESMRQESDKKTSGYDMNINLNVAGKNGNTQNIKAGLGSRVQWYQPGGTQFLIFNYEYGESSDVRDTDNSFAHYRHIWYDTDFLSWEMFTQLEQNEFTRLQFRALLGGGVRLNVVDGDNQTVYFGLGMYRSKEELDESVGTTDELVSYTNRLSTYLVYKHAITDHSRFVSTLYYQPEISEFSDYRLSEQLALQMDIKKNLSFNLSIDLRHDNEPPQTIEKTDTSYSTGFEYRF